MSLASPSPPFGVLCSPSPKLATFSFSVSATLRSSTNRKNSGNTGRRVWRRRKLTKKDEQLAYYTPKRVPFLEEQVRKMKEDGTLLAADIAYLLLREENRFDFANQIAAEANALLEKNPDEYGEKKPILHALSNRLNEAGIKRPDAYMRENPFERYINNTL